MDDVKTSPSSLPLSLHLSLSPSLPPFFFHLRVPADKRRSHGASDVHTAGVGTGKHGCLATAARRLPATAAAATAAEPGVSQ